MKILVRPAGSAAVGDDCWKELLLPGSAAKLMLSAFCSRRYNDWLIRPSRPTDTRSAMTVLLPITLSSTADMDLIAKKATIRESLSKSFVADVVFYTLGDELDCDAFLGTHLTITFELNSEDGSRTFDGIVRRVALVGENFGGTDDGEHYVYRAELRPWLWFLRHSKNCRAFHAMTAPDIVSQIAGDQELGPIEWNLTSADYVERDYCVQYNESDAHFIHRLLQAEGISYSYSHDDGEHTLSLTDDFSSAEAIDGYADVPYQPQSGDRGLVPDHFSTWTNRRSTAASTITVQDYDPTKPRVDLTSSSVAGTSVYPSASQYEYPGCYLDADTGAAIAGVRLAAKRMTMNTVYASGTARGLQPGAVVTMSTHVSDDQNQDYLVVAARHEIDLSKPAGTDWYFGKYQLVPADTEIRPTRTAKKPRIRGPQTARVVGPDGQDVNTDDSGRIQVQFYWDALLDSGDADPAGSTKNSSWVRCSQTLAGNGWGACALPRIGQEVIVEYLEGDPDRPLVTGTVYNADMVGPLTLPDESACTSLKTKTIGAESADQGHELTFDDTADAEAVTFQSERDFARIVKNNDDVKVGFDKQDPGDQTIAVFNNQTLTVGDDAAADGSQTIEVKSDRTVTIKEGSDSLTVTQGDLTVSIDAGSATITAANQIVLQVGSSQLTLDASGVTIQGTNVEIDAQGSYSVSGAEIQEEASASMTLKGGMVQIN